MPLATNTPVDTPVPTDTPTDTPTATPVSTDTPTDTPTVIPGVTLSASSGGYGQSIIVSGAAFGDGEPVSLYWDSVVGAPFAFSATGANGLFAQSVAVPQLPMGPHLLIAVGQHTDTTYTAPFQITPQAGLAHYFRHVADPDLLKAAGFGANETVEIHLTSPSGPLFGATHTNSVGSLNPAQMLAFTVPSEPMGTYTLWVVGQTSGASAPVAYTLVPQLMDTPYTTTAGSAITLRGTGFGPNEVVHLKLYCSISTCPAPTALGTTQTDANGSFTLPGVTIPATAPLGRHEIAASGDSSGAFAIETVVVASGS